MCGFFILFFLNWQPLAFTVGSGSTSKKVGGNFVWTCYHCGVDWAHMGLPCFVKVYVEHTVGFMCMFRAGWLEAMHEEWGRNLSMDRNDMLDLITVSNFIYKAL